MEKVNLIFDVDGTLFDSYPAIIDRTFRVLKSFGVNIDQKEIYAEVIQTSVGAFLAKLEKTYCIEEEALNKGYANESEDYSKITLFPKVKETLHRLKEAGFNLFIYTHRGTSTYPLFKKLEIDDCFKEIVDATMPFSRKPSPDALLYLVRKYGLDNAKTYYVGDRKLDIECANNARIKSILFESAKAPIGYCNPTIRIASFDGLLVLLDA